MYEMDDKEMLAVMRVLKSGQLFRHRGAIPGECDKFERNLCTQFDVSHALLVNSGTSALICALAACDIGPGDEVIVPAYTFMATALAVLSVGAIPILADIDASLTIDPASAAAKISPYTRAIIPVHMGGRPCNMDALMTLARDHSLWVIEDACQACGASYRHARLGTIGHAGTYSFNQFKIISAGEGGAVVTNDRSMYEKAFIQHDVGCAIDFGRDISVPNFAGGNMRVSEITGAMLQEQLKRLDSILARLRERQRVMTQELEDSTGCTLAPTNCAAGNSGQFVSLQFESPAAAARALQALRAERMLVSSPLDTNLHVYTNWEPVLNQRGAYHPKLNAFKLTDRQYSYSKDMCQRSLDILSSTIALATDLKEDLPTAAERARRVRAIVETA